MMEQTIGNTAKRAGWSESETNLLWETADEAQQQGIALKTVFERIARETGRRPNSIRNYYYAQVRQRLGNRESAQRFVPFEEHEVLELLEQVLRERAEGKSVRSCLQRMSGGNHSLMLRYQNKYRSVIKTRPELVQQVVDKLRAENIDVRPPEVKSRTRTSLSEVMTNLTSTAQQQGDPELVRALETIGDYLLGSKSNPQSNKGSLNVKIDMYRMALDEQRHAQAQLCEAAQELITPIKEFLALSAKERSAKVEDLSDVLASRIGALEECAHNGEPMA